MQKILLGILVFSGALMPPVERRFDQWKGYGGGVDASQYSSLNQINKSNVSKLAVAWTYDPGGAMTTNPMAVDGIVYVARQGGIAALEGATGKELWRNASNTSSRGMNYWESMDGSDRRLLVINGGQLRQINARTGEDINVGANGRISLVAEADRQVSAPGGNPGRVYKDIFVVSSPASGVNYDSSPGDVRAYDIMTGKLKWQFHSVPKAGEPGAETWPPEALAGAGGVHNWSEFSVDEEKGIAFVPFGTARYDFYGGNRKGNNLYANSLVALDINTGKKLWHYQMVHHDLWDYDLPTSPKLLTVTNNGRRVDVVAQPAKHGFLFVLNRETGVPIWPIEERAVPQSDVPGEYSSPTQPFPTKPPAFSRQKVTEADVNPFLSPGQRERALQVIRSSRNEGLFTPPSAKGSIQLPGHNGGANWGSSAVDPTKGTMYVASKELPTFLRINAPGGAGGGRGGGGGAVITCGGGGRGAAAPGGGGAPGGGRGGAGGGGAAGPGRGGAAGFQAPQAPAQRGGGAGAAAPGAGGARGGGAGAGGARGGGAGAGGARGGGGAGAAGGGGGARAYRPEGFVEYTSPYDFANNYASVDAVTPGCVSGMTFIGPPWSQLTAFDLNAGTILWQVPNGGVSALGERGKNTGSYAPRGGVVVTAGGLVFTGTPSDRKFHAYDQDTGKIVWEYDLPGAPEGVPAVFQADGREFIIVPVGGASVFQPAGGVPFPPAAAGEANRGYIVFALPK